MSTMGYVEYECPLCGKNFSYMAQFSYTTFGRNLDFKPYGAARIPTPIPKCPNCNLVFSRDIFSEEEINKLKLFLKENNIFEIDKNMPNYYYLAKEFELLDKNIETIIFYYISAIWENCDKNKFETIANVVFHYFSKIAETDENYYIYKLMKLDFLRRLGKFDDAVDIIEILKKDKIFPHKKFNKMLDIQSKLIRSKDTEEYQMPE